MRKITLLFNLVLFTIGLNAQLTITPLWEFSTTQANLSSGYVDDTKNGFDVSADGTKLYLSTRAVDANQVAIYNASTGVRTGYLPALSGFASNYGGDVAVDDNGAIYACSAIISPSAIKIARWANDAATPTLFISTTAHTGTGTNRIGYAMDVRINSEGDGFIVMHKNGTAEFLIWTIENNAPVSQDPLSLTATMTSGVAITDLYARISIINDNTFWVDGNVTRPQLVTITKNGTEINSTPTGLAYTTLGFRSDINVGVGGTTEFSLGGSRYLVFAANNHSTTYSEGHMSRLQKLAATGVAVDGAVIATLPSTGLGKTTDASHFVESVVYVNGNDAYIYLMGGFNGIAAFKASLPTKTFTVTVPNGTEKVYVAGTFTGKSWNNTDPFELTATANPNEFTGTFPCVDGVEYKYLCEKGDWDYAEAVYNGGDDPNTGSNRTYNVADVVPIWYRVKSVQMNVSFAEGSAVPSQLFVKGSFNGWATPIELTKSGNTFSTNLSGILSDKIPANTQYKYYTNDEATENWENNADNTPKGNRWSIAPVMNDVVERFTTMLTTELNNVVINARIARTYSGIEVIVDGESTIELYTLNGVLIEKTRTNGTYTRDLNNGVYIIRINGKATKFVK